MVLGTLICGTVLIISLLLLTISRKLRIEKRKADRFLEGYQKWYDELRKGPLLLPREDDILGDGSEEKNEAKGMESSAVMDSEDLGEENDND